VAKVILEPIGSPFDPQDPTYLKNVDRNSRREARIENIRKRIADGWGQDYVDRVHRKEKLTSWERVRRLADAGTPLRAIGTLVNYGEAFGSDKRSSPAAGVITAFIQVEGRHVVVIANDNVVASGSWWPRSPEKIQRAQSIALKLKVPVIYLVDCSGLFLPEQGRTFPGATGAGHIFKMNSLLSDAGVPQIAGVMGDSIAGGGYMPIISDKVFMTERAYMVIAGAALVKGAKSQQITSLSIGGPDVHVHLSGCADERVPDDSTCILRIRQEIGTLPSSATTYYRHGVAPAPPQLPTSDLRGIFPANHTAQYDTLEVIARLVDDSMFWEVLPEIGTELITGIARISGLYVGIIANRQDIVPHPSDPSRKRVGGILYREGIAKISAFSRACDSDGLPIVWLQDIAGFDLGPEAEKLGLLGFGSNLIYTNSTNTTPMITVLLRKASGAGYYAMAGLPFDPVLQLSTPVTRLGVMEGRTLAIGTFNAKLDDNFNIASEDPEERRQLKAAMKDVEDRIEQDLDPVQSARRGDTDELLLFDEIRDYLECIVEMCYQSTGVRRIKNPRIWTVHDFGILATALLNHR